MKYFSAFFKFGDLRVCNFTISLFQMGLYLSLCDLGNNNIAIVLLILGYNRTSFEKKIICRATLICSATEIKIDR